MGLHLANRIVKLLVKNGDTVKNAKALILGITFKENCPDIRNTRVIDIIKELEGFGIDVNIYDPYADPDEVKEEYGVQLEKDLGQGYDLIVLAVNHAPFKNLDLNKLKKDSDSVVFDVKSFLPIEEVTARL